MNPPKLRSFIILACVLLLSCSDADEGKSPHKTVDQIERQLEMHLHENLLARQSMADSSLAPFTTDGCSGGLSVGWEYLAEQIERVREQHGDLPPWENCCIAHDRLYHAAAAVGATAEESFNQRKQADLGLLACIIKTGDTRTLQLGREYDVSPETVITLYKTIAELMYRAVRVGGIPCSGLPWRWGYGWPECG